MPKTIIGIYIKAEKSIKKLIEVLSSKSPVPIIIKDIDEYSCIISANREIFNRVNNEIEKVQNKFLFDDQHFEK